MDMEAAVRKTGGVWPPYRGISPKDYSPGHLFSAAGVNRGKPSASDKMYMSNGPDEPCTLIGTRKEFDDCTDRLRNEPSFDDHPDAKCFVQKSNGSWVKHKDLTAGSSSIYHQSRWGWSYLGWEYVQQGEVIGDWKDTLRLRPEEKKMETQGEINLCESCALNETCRTPKVRPVCFVCLCTEYDEKKTEGNSTGNIPGWLKEVENKNHEVAALNEVMDTNDVPRADDDGVRYSLWGRVCRYAEMVVEEELNRRANEVPSASGNAWHERGEFPPVGTVCERLHGKVWLQTKIIGWDDSKIVFTTRWDYDCAITAPSKFRPIQTERERLFEKALGMTRDTNSVTEAVCILRDANMLKMPEDKPE